MMPFAQTTFVQFFNIDTLFLLLTHFEWNNDPTNQQQVHCCREHYCHKADKQGMYKSAEESSFYSKSRVAMHLFSMLLCLVEIMMLQNLDWMNCQYCKIKRISFIIILQANSGRDWENSMSIRSQWRTAMCSAILVDRVLFTSLFEIE